MSTPEEFTVKKAVNEDDFLKAKELILEYVNWLGIDLSFQNFDKEITTMPITYGDPDGGLFLIMRGESAVGVAGIKRFNEKECELKRMYIQPSVRGKNLGQLLMTACINCARDLNYEKIKLDSAGFMTSAIRLYKANGFKEIEAYRHNPYEEAKFFELKL